METVAPEAADITPDVPDPLPDVAGEDPETGQLREIQTSKASLRARYAEAAAAERAAIAASIRRAGAQHLQLRTDRDWLLDIVRFVAAQRHARTRGTTR